MIDEKYIPTICKLFGKRLSAVKFLNEDSINTNMISHYEILDREDWTKLKKGLEFLGWADGEAVSLYKKDTVAIMIEGNKWGKLWYHLGMSAIKHEYLKST